MAEFGIIAEIALYYEIAIIIVYSGLVIGCLKHYNKKKTNLSKMLVSIFTSYIFAIVFSMISKIFNVLWGGVPYDLVSSTYLNIVALFHSGRFGFVFVIVGTMISEALKTEIFEKQKSKTMFYSKMGLGTIIIVYQIVGYKFDMETKKSVGILDIIGFALMFLYMIIVYFPFMSKAFKLSSRVEDLIYKKAIKSLGIMALGFMLIFFCFLLDRLMLILFSWAYSIFYFIAWLFVFVSTIAAYKGYLEPAGKGEIQENE
jgi:hypothetical protein